jgi:hypothetical protein
MKRSIVRPMMVGLALILLAVVPAAATSSGVVTQDGYVLNGSFNNAKGLAVLSQASTNPLDPSGTCLPGSSISYLVWDLSGTPQTTTVNSARMTLRVIQALSTASTLTLYRVDTNALWNAATQVGAPGALGEALGSVTGPLSVGSTVVFEAGGGLNNAPLLPAYINGKNNDVTGQDAVTFAVSFSAGCVSLTTVAFDEANPSIPQVPGTNPATLTIWQSNNQTAVTLRTFRADGATLNWPLIAGLGVLAAVVVGGLALTRKRAAGR